MNDIYISHIYYRFNTYPEELICAGMIMIDSDTNQYKAKISDIKLKLIKKLLPNKSTIKLFNFSVNQLIKYDGLSVKYLERLNAYENGIIKIDKPSYIFNMSLDKFDDYFYKRIEENFITK